MASVITDDNKRKKAGGNMNKNKKKKKSSSRDLKEEVSGLRELLEVQGRKIKQVTTQVGSIDSQLMLGLATRSAQKSGIIEKAKGFEPPNTMLEYRRHDGTPGVTICQRGWKGDDKEIQAANQGAFLVSDDGEPRFEGPVTSNGKSDRLKGTTSTKYVLNAPPSNVEIVTYPIELMCAQVSENTRQLEEQVGPTMEALLADNAQLKNVVAEQGRQLAAVMKILPMLAKQVSFISLDTDNTIPTLESVLAAQPRAPHAFPEPMAKLPIAELVPFKGAMDEGKVSKADAKKRPWYFTKASIESRATRHARITPSHDDEEDEGMVEDRPPTPPPFPGRIVEQAEQPKKRKKQKKRSKAVEDQGNEEVVILNRRPPPLVSFQDGEEFLMFDMDVDSAEGFCEDPGEPFRVEDYYI